MVSTTMAVRSDTPAEALIPGISFGSSGLSGESSNNPTSLQFGPDDRLYVGQQNGSIYAYNIERSAANDYDVVETEQIDLVKNGVNNHDDDDGSLNTGEGNRQLTGLLVSGTSSNPILYVSSSDPRIGAGSGGPGNEKNLDTNSGVISKLTCTGGMDANNECVTWSKVDLIRGLPRSEENHATNGMQLDTATNTLYIAQGGHTNAGSPSNNFALTTEYALSAALLEADLDVIEALPTQIDGEGVAYKYNLPTVGNVTQAELAAADNDHPDPWGGDDGLNQAMLDPNGPVTIFASGFRNLYDIVLTDKGIYGVDNGANGSWGGYPQYEESYDCTNDFVEGEPGSTGNGPDPSTYGASIDLHDGNNGTSVSDGQPDSQVNNKNGLHQITSGYYGGHPAPVRGNPAGAGLYYNGTFYAPGDTNLPVGWPPVPVSEANPVECDFQNSGVDDGALANFGPSTNGITEYTASNFGGALEGVLYAAGYGNNGGIIFEIALNGAGDTATNCPTNPVNNCNDQRFSGFGNSALDVTALGDDELFPGTIWAATYGADNITIFEPADFTGENPNTCDGTDDDQLDEDGDLFDNADEIDNGSDPCSAGSQPQDSDGDKTSNLNDPDDDNDTILDDVDVFQLDPDNGTTTALPVIRDLFNDIDSPPSFFGMGMSGIMANGDDYSTLIDDVDDGNGGARQLIAGGTSGLFTDTEVGDGDAHQDDNDQKNAFQFGIDVDSNSTPFTIKSRMVGPFTDVVGNYASQGIYVGSGDQDNFIKLVLNDGEGTGGFELASELAQSTSGTSTDVPGVLNEAFVDLYLSVNPSTGVVTGAYALGSAPETIVQLQTKTATGDLLDAMQGTHSVGGLSSALAVGTIATSTSVAVPFAATWDFIYVTEDTDPQLTIAPSSLDFGEVVEGETSAPSAISLSHTGGVLSGPLSVSAGTITGPDAAEFSSDFAGPIVLSPGESTSVDVTFSPATTSAGKSASIEFVHDGVNGTQVATLTGDGVDPISTLVCVNVGGDALATTSLGRSFAADSSTYYDIAGTVRDSGHAITGTVDDELFQTERYATNLSYSIPVPAPGEYTVDLYFAETYFGAPGSGSEGGVGDRIFDVTIEGTTVLEDFDLFSEAGTTTAVTKQYVATTADTELDVDLSATENNATLGGICVSAQSGDNEAPVVDPIPDQSSFEGDDISNAGLSVSATDDDSLSYSATGLPSGVDIEPTNGQIIGVIDLGAAANSPYTVEVSVSDGVNAPTTVQFEWVVHELVIEVIACVNAGGPSVTGTALGPDFDADGPAYYDTAGTLYSKTSAISGTTDDVIFQTERYADPLSYSIPVPEPGDYFVDLYFAELYIGAPGGGSELGAGDRLFDIEIEGETVETGFDIFAEVGALAATSRQYSTTTVDTEIDIDFDASEDNAKLSAVCVSRVDPTPPVTISIDGPIDGSTVTTNDPVISWETTGLPTDQGDHVHLYVDTDLFDLRISPLALSGSETFSSLTGRLLPDGEHTIILRPADTGHSEYEGIEDRIDFTVDAGSTVLHRVNAGGPEVAAADGSSPDWAQDTGESAASPTKSPYLVSGSNYGIADHNLPVDLTDLSIAGGPAPLAIFQKERWDNDTAPEMAWAFPVTSGSTVEVRLYFAETYDPAQVVGSRDFDVEVEGAVPAVYNDISPYDLTLTGDYGFMLPHQVVMTDDTLNLEFLHGVNENPAVKAIEIIELGVVSTNPEALIEVNAGLDIDASTFTGGSFVVTNTGDQDIVGISFDLSSASLPDYVFDPNGNAGDAVAKCFEPSAGVTATTGYVVPANNCADPFSAFHNGIDDVDGFDVISGTFTDFNPTEVFSFAVDIDPTSIKNDQTAGDAGSVSGLELSGTTVTIDFADGTTVVTNLFDEGSLGGSAAVAAPDAPAAPTIDMPGRTLNGIVTTAAQDVVITGEPLADVTLMQIDAHLYLDSGLLPFPGYDLDPLEANSAVAKVLYTGQLDATGTLTIPVTLLQTPVAGPAPDGGINHFVAVVEGPGEQNSPTSNTIVVELDPNATNQAPEVVIVAPADNTIGDVNTPMDFEAASLDNEEGELSASIVWTSDVDGALGTGGTITTMLTQGQHVITASATDTDVIPLTGSDTITVFIAQDTVSENVLYRVNAGGPQVAAADGSSPDWAADEEPVANRSPFLVQGSNFGISTHNDTVDLTDPSVAGGPAPLAVFQKERWDNDTAPEMAWAFPVTDGATIEVRLYFAETYNNAQNSNGRFFDVAVEGTVPSIYDDISPFNITGAGDKGVMLSHQLTMADDTLNLEFLHGAEENPAVKAIEIIEFVTTFDNLAPGVTTPEPQTNLEGDDVSLPIAAVGPEAEDTLGYSATGLPAGLDIDPLTGEIAGTIELGAAALSPYTVEVTVTDDGSPAESTIVSFEWTVTATMPSALVEVTPGEGLAASTYAGGDSFQITNQSPDGVTLISSVSIDLGTAVLPDMVFDPTGAGGDATSECFTANAASALATGFTAPGNICVDPFSVARQGGFDVLTVDFTDFGPGETFTFSTDIDPNSIQGVPGAGNAGSVSGYELLGATVTVVFSDGSTIVSSLYEDGTLGGAQAVVAPEATVAPSIEVVDVGVGPATVPDAAQVVTVTGTPGDEVSLLVMDSRLYIATGAPPFNVVDSTYYANEAMEGKTLYTATIGALGTVDIPITLQQTASLDGTPDGGLNQIVAVSSTAPYALDAQVSQISNVVTLALGAGSALVEVTPNGGLAATTFGDNSFQITNTSVGAVKIDSVEIDLSTAALPDMVFDPTGAGGDATAACFTVNSGGVESGLVDPVDPCVDPYSQARNGGFDVLTLTFDDFNGGEEVWFTTDVDPNSIQGVPGAGNAGAVSGYELTGATVTVVFSDGSTIVSSLYEDGSLGGAQAVVAPEATVAPSIEVVDVGVGPATVPDAAQVVTVTGTPGDNVSLMVMDSRLFIASGDAPFNVADSTYYANEAMSGKTLYTGVIGAGGTIDIPITLLQTAGTGATPDGGLNQIVAVTSTDPYAADTQVSQTSNVITLRLGEGSALVEVTPGGALGASTYGAGSLQIANTSSGGVMIDSVEFDLSTGILPDMVFDPTGAGGDATASCLAANSGAAAVGFVAPGDPCADPFSQARNGGFDVLSVDFTDFGPGEAFTFTTDVDPNSIQGVPGAGNAGAVSGYELTGATVTVVFSDGSTIVSSLYEDGSLGGSQAVIASAATVAPSIEVVGVGVGPATVPDAVQVVTVTGTPGDNVSLMVMDSRLFIASGDAPFNVADSTYYANEAMSGKTLYTGVIGAGGTIDIPITLLQTAGTGATPDGGLNQLVAVTSAAPYAADTQVSQTSNVITLLWEIPDVEAPVISLVGDDPLELTVGDAYVEPGATALDDVDGDLTLSVVVDASAVDTAVPGVYSVTYNVVDAAGNAAVEVVRTVTVSVGVPDIAGLTVLGSPCVIYDTNGAGESPFVGGETRTVQVTGSLTGQGGAASCVPEGASSVVFTISSIDPLTEGNLLLTPAGVAATGEAGVVNYGANNGLNNANTVTVPVNGSGAVDIGANAGPAGAVPTTDVRLVAVGYYSPDVDPDLKFFPLNPCAVADSRTNQGASDVFDGPNDDGLWPVGSDFPDIDVTGSFNVGQGGGNGLAGCGVPAGADAVMVNVVAVNMEGGSGHLSVGTGGSNPANEATTPFAVLSPKMNNGATTIVNLSGGTIAIDIDGDPLASTMIRVEILGYYDQDTAGLDFVDVTPCAVFDTRTVQGATGSFAGERQHGPANTTTYQIAGDSVPVGQGGVVDTGGGVGSCEVPDDAQAVLINLEAVNALQEGNFWVSAAGTTTTGGVLNFNNVTPKMNNANAVVVPLSAAGQLDLEINAGNFTAPGTAIAHARGVILGYYN